MADSGLGKDLEYEESLEYTGGDDFTGQGDTRVVKHILYAWLVERPPSVEGQPPQVVEKTAYEGQEVSVEELGPIALERGERLGAFYTDEEREQIDTEAEELTTGEEAPAFSEMSEQELGDYIRQHNLNVTNTVAIAGSDPELAVRVLEAEEIATDGDPRAGVVSGLQKIVGGG
jgi:hypothetical protein